MTCHRSAIWILIQEQARQQTGKIIEVTFDSDGGHSSSCTAYTAATELVSSSCCSNRAAAANTSIDRYAQYVSNLFDARAGISSIAHPSSSAARTMFPH
jgi:hypothetical protein